MRILIGAYGQARFPMLGTGHFIELLRNQGAEVDVVFHTWNGKKNSNKVAPWVDASKLRVMQASELIQFLTPKKYAITEHVVTPKSLAVQNACQDSQLCWNLTQMFFSIQKVLELAHEQTKKINYDLIILTRFDFRPESWNLPPLISSTIYYPNLLTGTKFICDWAFAFDSETLTRLVKVDLVAAVADSVRLYGMVKGELALKSVISFANIKSKGFTAGGHLVRDQDLKIKWGQPDPRQRPLAFRIHFIKTLLSQFLNRVDLKLMHFPKFRRLLSRIWIRG